MTLFRSQLSPWAYAGVAALVLSVVVHPAGAQTVPTPSPAPRVSPQSRSLMTIPETLLNQALTVTVRTQVPESSTVPAWEVTEAKPTLPGAAVSVKLVGDSLVVLVHVTPYHGPDGLMLVTQAQVWLRDKDSLRYHTALNTFNVAFGEPVAFYPLGAGKGRTPLRLVIVVQPYQRPEPAPASGSPESP
ncbi:MAG TPA: hypothetical protein VLH39_03395 [Magnetospirillaceae bacterium]|nr:hypothetical protein [Magnetospirillaceae bacterium]